MFTSTFMGDLVDIPIYSLVDMIMFKGQDWHVTKLFKSLVALLLGR